MEYILKCNYMNVERFRWDENNVAHIARHHVAPDEAEEVLASGRRIIWRAGENRYRALGRTEAGRYLFVVFDYYKDEKAAYVVTAREQDKKERKLYKRMVSQR